MEGTETKPIYLRETLMEMEEIRKYRLNAYFLRAILKERFYTLEDAEQAIQKAIEGK